VFDQSSYFALVVFCEEGDASFDHEAFKLEEELIHMVFALFEVLQLLPGVS
jgi:hypothetical protein